MNQPLVAPLVPEALDRAFLEARSFNVFTDQPVSDETLQRLYEVLKWGPTSMNTQPARFIFLRSAEAKARLLPTLAPGNVDNTRKAPVTVIVAQDRRFFDHLPTQFKAYDAKPLFEGNAALAESTAFRNSSLQGAYLMIAARLLGLDVGAMSGFDPDKLNAEFFPDGQWKVNFLVNLGYGDAAGNYPRGPRLAFESVAQVGSKGDSYDNALAETINGLYKAEMIHRRAPWKTRESVELATLEWVSWFNHHRLLEPIGYIPPAEAEANYYRQLATQAATVA